MKWGSKADGLNKMRDIGINVPKYAVLGQDFFISFLEDVDALETAQLVSVKSAWIKDTFASIRKKIREGTLSDAVISQIRDVVKELRFPIAVRSSASVEDNSKSSAAGVFKTILNVSWDNLIDAVKEVISSLYGENCIISFPEQDFHPNHYYMGLIFQEMVDSRHSGVLFTADPITRDPGELQLDVVRGLGDKLVSGLCDAKSFTIKRHGDIDGKLRKTFPFIDELREKALICERIMEKPVDMEWAVCGGTLFILQLRPVTAIRPKPEIKDIMIFSMSALGPETYPYLGFLQKRYPKWLKKGKFYKFCEENNITTNKWKFVVFNERLFQRLNFAELFSDFDSEYVSYHLNSQTALNARTGDIPAILSEFIKLFRDNLYCVSIREFLPNEMAAIANVNEDGSVQVECVSGKMFHLNSGMAVPTKYLIDRHGNIAERVLQEQEVYVFDPGIIEIVPSGRKKIIELDDCMVKRIEKATRRISAFFGPCTTEWWIWGDKLYAADMSVLKSEGVGRSSVIISGGKTEGRLFRLPELDEDTLADLNKFSAISVNDPEFDTEKVNIFKALEEKMAEWSRSGPVLLYSEKPFIFLAPFRKYISGFVFKNASNLCHLSLILREAGIPAISLDNRQINNIIDGEMYMLDAEKGCLEPL